MRCRPDSSFSFPSAPSWCAALTVLVVAAACGGGGAADAGKEDVGDGPQRPAVRAPELPVAAEAEAFRARCAELAEPAEQAGEAVVAGAGGNEWLLVRELRHLGAGRFWGEAAQEANRSEKEDRRDPLPAILDFDRQMDEAGIDWIFVPVPAKAAVDPSVVPGAPQVAKGRVDAEHAAFLDLLREQGVPVLDLMPYLHELVVDGERAHCRTDSHWTSKACAVAAEQIAVRVAEAGWRKDAAMVEFGVETSEASIQGDMAGMTGGGDASAETVELSTVTGPATTDRQSPVLVFGDSHCLVFHTGGDDMHAERAGFADHLARALSMPVDVLAVRGSGATPARVEVRRDDRLAGKKFVVWCLTVRDFTEGGWAKVPMAR
jgi:hypothetical protein